jgi:hypothetical protein
MPRHYYTIPIAAVNSILLRNTASEITRLRYNSQFLWTFPTFPTDQFVNDLDELQFHVDKIQNRLSRRDIPILSFFLKRLSKYELKKIAKSINTLHTEAEEFRKDGEVANMIPTWIFREPNWDPANYFAG